MHIGFCKTDYDMTSCVCVNGRFFNATTISHDARVYHVLWDRFTRSRRNKKGKNPFCHIPTKHESYYIQSVVDRKSLERYSYVSVARIVYRGMSVFCAIFWRGRDFDKWSLSRSGRRARTCRAKNARTHRVHRSKSSATATRRLIPMWKKK